MVWYVPLDPPSNWGVSYWSRISIRLEVRWRKMIYCRLWAINGMCHLSSLCMSNRLANGGNCLRWCSRPLITQQSTPDILCHSALTRTAMQCLQYSNCDSQESHYQRNWSSTTPVYCQFSCTVQNVGPSLSAQLSEGSLVRGSSCRIGIGFGLGLGLG